MKTLIWKRYQQLYSEQITNHSDDLSNFEIKIVDDIVGAAINFITEKNPVALYPGKSYMVGIIYATLLNKVYNVPVLEALDDPDLLLSEDPYFKPYSQDKETYDEILLKLSSISNWLESGWAPQTTKYFYAECTEEGFIRALDAFLLTGTAVESE